MKRGDSLPQGMLKVGWLGSLWLFGPVVLTLAIALAWPSLASAADAADLIKEGVALRRHGNDAGALQKFQEAYQIDKSSRALAQMGLAEHALGRWVLAYEHLTEALNAKKDPWIEKNRPTINEALSLVNERVGRIEILGGTAGAELRIDGVPRGTLPLGGPLTLTIGTVTIDLSAPGFIPVQRMSVVRARQTGRESFDALVAVADRIASTAQAGGTGASKLTPPKVSSGGSTDMGRPIPVEATDSTKSTETATTTSTSADTGSDGPSPLRSGAKWVAWGLGAAALGVGVFGLVKQNQAANDFDKSCGLDMAGTIQPRPGSMMITRGDCEGFRDSIDFNYRLELIGFVGAAVLAGAGLALWLTEPKPSSTGSVAFGCSPGMTAGGGLWMECALRL